jgi:GNAT superfamily N-acetyltransferase
VLDRPPEDGPSPFEVRPVATLDEHRAAIEVAIEGFGFGHDDADDERRRAPEVFATERDGAFGTRLLAWDGDRPVATGQLEHAALGSYFGGVATLPSDRGRGAMGAIVGAAWEVAVRRGAPAVVAYGGAMSAGGMRRLGFRSVARVVHLVDRLGA